MTPAAASRRCRPRPQSRRTGDLRPTDVVGVFFICGLAFLLAAALAGVVQSLLPAPSGTARESFGTLIDFGSALATAVLLIAYAVLGALVLARAGRILLSARPSL